MNIYLEDFEVARAREKKLNDAGMAKELGTSKPAVNYRRRRFGK